MARDFLLEIGTEELPASACNAVLQLLPERVAGLFAAERIDIEPAGIEVLVAARRIAVLIEGVPESQAARETAQRGPAEEAAFDAEGNPTPAALGFARAKGVEPDQLEIREENGRRSVFAVQRAEGRPTEELLPELCLKIVRDMYFPKNMRWGYKDLRFSRPVRWLVALYGADVVPFAIAGLLSGRRSLGHRWLGGPVDLPEAGAYRDAMRSVKVMVDQDEREAFLWERLRAEAAARGLDVVDPMGKMNEVLFLVEWPTVLDGRFGEEHLRLPEDVLVTAMQSHQRYFPLIAGCGSLAPEFLYVTNGDAADAATITAGNERVLEGRIEDAEFSFDKDLATGIEQMAAELDRVVFHEKIGTLADKTARLVTLTGYLADILQVAPDVRDRALEAARLAKADQVSVMVREFADLEGAMGETYARLEGFHEEVAQAIREQFLPDAAGGAPPRTVTGALLATAEKVDNVVAAFAVGEPPSGSKDPYGLRRAAMGMVAIAFLHDFAYDVEALVARAYAGLERFPRLAPGDEVVPAATEFILERLTKLLTDNDIARDAVEAALPTSRGFLDLRRRAAAVEAVRGSALWDDLVVVSTRPSNLAKKLPAGAGGPVDSGLFVDEAEGLLFAAWDEARGRVACLVESGDYDDALAVLAGLRPAVDRYFDDILVMAEDDALRINRLRLLDGIAASVRGVAFLDRLQ